MREIEAIIDSSDMEESARAVAKRIFGFIARAESRAHGVALEDVHFHEVGAVDSIVDVISAAVCLDDLGFSEVIVDFLNEGRGFVRCQHGILPVPVPAVSNIVAESGIPLQIVDVEGELVTPTGAAIAAAVRTRYSLPRKFVVRAIGLGAGKRSYSRPSLLRAMVVEECDDESVRAPLCAPHLWKLETEMDDCSGEALGFVLEELRAAGAREVHYIPVFMKKDRPGYQIQALCSEERIAELESVLFSHSTTIGVRREPVWRTALAREMRRVETPYGSARVKLVTLPDGSRRAYPEHDDVASLARDAHVGYQDVCRAVLFAAEGFVTGE